MVLLILEDGKHGRGESRSWIQSDPGFKGTNKGDGMKSILTGHILLILCCIFYLLWWCYAFKPGFTESRVAGKAGMLLLITAVTGLAGVAFSVMGCNQPGSRPAPIPSIVILVGGIVIYIVLMIGSSVFLHRQVTTELLLIIGWLVLEALSYQNAYCHEGIGRPVMMALMLAAVIASVLSLYFYLQYYQVVESRGYVYGMIPLIMDGVCMTAFLTACRICR